MPLEEWCMVPQREQALKLPALEIRYSSLEMEHRLTNPIPPLRKET